MCHSLVGIHSGVFAFSSLRQVTISAGEARRFPEPSFRTTTTFCVQMGPRHSANPSSRTSTRDSPGYLLCTHSVICATDGGTHTIEAGGVIAGVRVGC